MRHLLLTAALMIPMATMASAAERLITVTGEGQVAATPDMATVSLGVTSEAKTSAEAMAANSAQMQMMLDSLTAAGIAAKDVQTNGLSLSPRWSQQNANTGEREINGFIARNSVMVRVRELALLSDILGASVDQGANQLNGLSFGLSDPKEKTDAARRDAVIDARAKAMLYAEAAGVELGDVVSISEQGAYTPRPMMMESAAMARDSVPVAEGEVTVSATVTMVYEIAD